MSDEEKWVTKYALVVCQSGEVDAFYVDGPLDAETTACQLTRLLNEREKYRAALERIVRECHPGTHGEALMCIGDALAFAEEALKP